MEVLVLVQDVDKTLADFWDYCVLSERLTERVSKDYQHIIRRYLTFADCVVSRKTVKGYLTTYLRKKPKTYNNQLDGLRAFIGRYIKRSDIMEGFKKAYEPSYEPELPRKRQVRKGFYALTDDTEKSLYLLYATAGLRKNEALGLRTENIDRKLRCVKDNHDTRTKKSGITFYNEECAEYLDKIESWNGKVFKIGSTRFRRIWNKTSEAAGFRITPQVLRIWQATELGELGVPDRTSSILNGYLQLKNILRSAS